jgi:hypothetical protein
VVFPFTYPFGRADDYYLGLSMATFLVAEGFKSGPKDRSHR